MDRAALRQRGDARRFSGWLPLFSGVSLHHLHACAAQRSPRSLCFSENAGAGAGQGARSRRAFPFNIRRNIGIWKLLFMDDRPFAPDTARPAQWNRGAYLVNALGHCAECHSPRNFLGGIVASQRFAGGPDPDGKGWVPNITQKGLSDWNEKDIAYFLESGQTPDGDSAGGSMVSVIKNISQLSEADRAAIANYIKSLPPVDGPPKPKKADKGDDKS
jgi:mono/diheme cytochrome c family protein